MIEVTNLVKRHGGRAVVNNVSFTAEPGRVTGFLGPNGAGKSSTLRILLGLDRASSGTAHIDGAPYRALHFPLRKVGAMLDGPGAHRGRSARSHLTWVAQSNAIPRSRIGEVLELTGLAGDARKRVGEFSLGMGQRLGIATALLGDPEILVLDEPTNGLDPEGIRWMRSFLRAMADTGKVVLVSSHLMGEMEGVADDLVIIAQGKIVASGSTLEVRGNHASVEEAFFALTGASADTFASGGGTFPGGDV